MTRPWRARSGPSRMNEERIFIAASSGTNNHSGPRARSSSVCASTSVHVADVGHRLAHDRHVADPRHVAEHDRLIGQDGGGHHLQDRVLGAGHPDLAAERDATLDHEAIHRHPTRATPPSTRDRRDGAVAQAQPASHVARRQQRLHPLLHRGRLAVAQHVPMLAQPVVQVGARAEHEAAGEVRTPDEVRPASQSGRSRGRSRSGPAGRPIGRRTARSSARVEAVHSR